jgi:hypothetical protein
MSVHADLTLEQRQLLERVRKVSAYYAPLMPNDDIGRQEIQTLKQLESAGLVKYCPYPEEFWTAIGFSKDWQSSKLST